MVAKRPRTEPVDTAAGHVAGVIVEVYRFVFVDGATPPLYPASTVQPEVPPVPELPGTEPVELAGHVAGVIVDV